MRLSDVVFLGFGQWKPDDEIVQDLRPLFGPQVADRVRRKFLTVSTGSYEALLSAVEGDEDADIFLYRWLRGLNHADRRDAIRAEEVLRAAGKGSEPVLALAVAKAESNLNRTSSEHAVKALNVALLDTSFTECPRDQLVRETLIRSLGWELYRVGEFRKAIELFERAIEISTHEGFSNHVLAKLGLSASLWRQGAVKRGLRVLLDPGLARRCRDSGRHRTLLCLENSCARAALMADKPTIARHELDKARDLVHAVSAALPIAHIAENLHVEGLYAAHVLEDFDSAIRLVQDARGMFRSCGNTWGVVDSETSLCEIHMDQGFSPRLVEAHVADAEDQAIRGECLGLAARLGLLRDKLARR